ncbi:universal stress protein [Actinoplanes sp. NPDC051346]|uniref:universal stress protein n=1 Tax=Actinoplanes sp. NPDC051346 TaxID=3155048 RepID=UPI0034146932
MTTGLSAADSRPGDAGETPLELIRAARPGDTVVIGPSTATGTAVVAAVEDDGNCGQILRYAAAEARRRSAPLRVVHVWGARGDARPGARGCPRMSDADRLLSAVLYDHLPPEVAAEAEREILHDDDPVCALRALSAAAALLVVASRSRAAGAADPVGTTARGLIGTTECPLAVVIPASFAPPVPAPRTGLHPVPARRGRDHSQEER